MMRKALIAAAWIGLLVVIGALVASRLQISGDLRMFLPSPRTDEQRLLLDLVGRGPAARTLLLAISGAPPEQLAAASHALRDELTGQPEFELVANGADSLDAIDDALLPYRYLLSPTLDAQAFDAGWLRDELEARLADLASPAGGLVESWIPRDPTLEVLELAERWRPPVEPEQVDGVWMGPTHDEALPLLQTRDGGFDPERQQAAIAAIEASFAELGSDELRLELSGPGAFAVMLQQQTRDEATRLGLIATVVFTLMLVIAYRSLRFTLLAALPMATGALVALAAVGLLFPRVHGVTLAFGFTLLGLAQDYPVHLLSHLRPRTAGASASDPHAVARSIWGTLAAGVVSTCVAYLSFVLVGIVGLLQVATFAIAGLLAAAATTRWMLPPLLAPPKHDVAEGPLIRRLGGLLGRLPRAWPLAIVGAVLAMAALVGARSPLWNDNLGSLTPVPHELLVREGELRAALGAPDVRHLLVAEAGDIEQLLRASERIEPALQQLVATGALAGADLPSTYLPSDERQRERQQRLPTADALQAMLVAAGAGLPFKPGVFSPFVDDVVTARTLPPLTLDDVAGTPLASRLQTMLQPTADGGWVGLISLVGLADPDAVAALAERDPQWRLLDLKAASESLSAGYRERLLTALAIASILLAATLRLALRDWRRIGRIVAPMLAATVITAAVVRAGGDGFTLFHLISLVLSAGLGLDYALFFEQAGHDPASQRRALHSILLCAASTALVFGLLATSGIPVLQVIGGTTTTGVVLQFVLAAMLANRGRRDAGA